MSESFAVRLQKESFVFSAAHFITFDENICERLHGHNYRVDVELAGALDANHYVFDFIALRDKMNELTRALDHFVLLPTEHPAIKVLVHQDEVEVTFEERRWVFPIGDCVLLPVANTTAERLAEYLGRELLDWLNGQSDAIPEMLRIGVDENHDQWAVWTYRRGQEDPC